MDSRIKKLADLLVNYSLKIKNEDLFLIKGDPCTLPLLNAVYEAALAAGANPFIELETQESRRIFLNSASTSQLEYVNPIFLYKLNKADAILSVHGSGNTRNLAGINPNRLSARRQATAPLSRLMSRQINNEKLRWCGTMFPCNGQAQDAEMSFTDWTDFVFNAGHLGAKDPTAHWERVSKKQARLVTKLNKVKGLHFVTYGTDITMSVRGRTWLNCDGKLNFPDGELCTSPVENSVNGAITFTFPAIYMVTVPF